MGMQTMGSAPARNQVSAAGKPSKVGVKSIGELASAKATGKAAPTKGVSPKHFSNGKNPNVAASAGPVGKPATPVSKGTGVTGFSSTGLMPGMV